MEDIKPDLVLKDVLGIIFMMNTRECKVPYGYDHSLRFLKAVQDAPGFIGGCDDLIRVFGSVHITDFGSSLQSDDYDKAYVHLVPGASVSCTMDSDGKYLYMSESEQDRWRLVHSNQNLAARKCLEKLACGYEMYIQRYAPEYSDFWEKEE